MSTLDEISSDQLQLQLIDGIPSLQEIILYHRASKTLIVCDLAFNL
jgi:hypothetical protein